MTVFKIFDKKLSGSISGIHVLLFITGCLLLILNLGATLFRLSGKGDFFIINFSYIPIAPFTIIFFISYSIHFIYCGLNPGENGPKLLFKLLYGIIFIYGLLQFLTYFTSYDLTFSRLLFPTTQTVGIFPVNHMSPYTGLLFSLSSASLLVGNFTKNRRFSCNIRAATGIFIIFAGFVASMGYLYGSPFLYSGKVIPISAIASISFTITGFALLLLGGKKTVFLKLFLGKTASARLLRVFIPIIIAAYVLQGILERSFSDSYNLNPALLQALMTIISIVSSIIVVIFITNRVFRSANKAEQERLKVLEELKAVSNLQSLILNNSTLGIFMIRNNVFQWYNKKFQEIFGIKSEEMHNATPGILVQSEESSNEIKRILNSCTYNKHSVDERIYLKIHNGENLWCRFIGSVLDKENPDKGTVWIVEDITERHILRDKMRLLSATVESLSECVSITDTSNNIIFLNKAFLKTYGYTSDELMGKNIEIVSSPQNDSQIHKSILADTIKGEWEGELLNVRKDGTEFPIALASSKVLDEKNEVIALVGISKDITESKEAEARLKTYAEELRIANNAKDKLFSIISHDLRSPFSSIINFFQLFSEQYDNFTEVEKKEYLEKIRKFAEKSFELLENLLIWSSSQRGGIKINPENTRLIEVVNNQVELLKNSAAEKEITLNLSIDKELFVNIDKNMIKAVLRNLISNAIKFTNKGGQVTISAIKINLVAEVTIADTGVGIDQLTLEHIFSIDKVSSTYGTSNEKGTGLGLQICKEFIENSGGKIWAQSEKGKGSKFIFTIPLCTKANSR